MTKLKLLFLFLFSSTLLQGQNYIKENSCWYSIEADIWEHLYWVSHFNVQGDTIINNNQYRIIHRKYDWLHLESNGIDTSFYFSEKNSYQFIREDSKKIFQWINEEEKLIIDFDLEVGDTIEDGNSFEPHYIVEIDSFNIGTEVRKIFITNWEFEIYEGIGSQFGLLNGIGFQGPHQWNRLICYSQEEDNINLHDGWIPEELSISSCQEITCQNFTTSIINKASNSSDFKFHPNPIENEGVLFLPHNEIVDIKISINSIDGKEIISKIKKYNQQGIKINLSDLNSGIYILVIETKDKVYSKKIIKY